MAKTCAVACLYADEGMQGAAVRIGQQLGVSRADLMKDEGVEAARNALNGASFFRFLDPSRPESTVEYMFAEFDKMAPAGLQRVFLVDSAQVVRTSKVTPRLDRRQAVSVLLVELRELALRYRAVVIVVSQVGRGAYRSKKEDERVDPLAAGLETSAIEFMADLILHLDGNPTKESPAVKLKCPKNRLSAEGLFDLPLVMDFPRSRFLEADVAEVEAEEAAVATEKLKSVEQRIDDLLKAVPEGYLTGTIKTRAKARAADVVAALNRMVEDGRLVMDEQPRGGQKWKRSVGR
jgi:replicative DNA helicase